MPGTRVYADIILTEDKVNFSLKNVSEQQLNISADELTERFIRGRYFKEHGGQRAGPVNSQEPYSNAGGRVLNCIWTEICSE